MSGIIYIIRFFLIINTVCVHVFRMTHNKLLKSKGHIGIYRNKCVAHFIRGVECIYEDIYDLITGNYEVVKEINNIPEDYE